jgi:hypothetical protein
MTVINNPSFVAIALPYLETHIFLTFHSLPLGHHSPPVRKKMRVVEIPEVKEKERK